MKPVLYDFETQSAADLPRVGGRNYAAHESTRVYCACFSIDGELHLWLPGQDLTLPCFADLWPHQFGTPRHIESWDGPKWLPTVVEDAVAAGRTFTAHNGDMFDKHVWQAKLRPVPEKWGDTIHGCRAKGLPAGLDKLGQKFFGFGKDAGNAIMRKVMTLEGCYGAWTNKHSTPGNIAAIARYCVADVLILERVSVELGEGFEPEVVAANNKINDNGVQFDSTLAREIVDLGNRAAAEAGAEIERLTGGELLATDLRSVVKVKKWLASKGVILNSLRKEQVQKLLDDPESFVQETLEEPEHE